MKRKVFAIKILVNINTDISQWRSVCARVSQKCKLKKLKYQEKQILENK